MKHLKKQKRSWLPRVLIVLVLVAAVSVGSVVTVMANAVDITVYDKDRIFSFSMIDADEESVLARAETEGMEPISTIDEYVFSESSSVLTIKRNVRVSVTADGETVMFIAEEDTVLADALEDEGIAVEENDVIEPALDTVLDKDTTVAITRSHRIHVRADGKTDSFDQLEGTVADALAAANVKVGRLDKVTPAEDTVLTEGMEITVARRMNLKFIVDGEELEDTVVAYDAKEAAAEAGIELGEFDKVYFVKEFGEESAAWTDPVESEMTLRVERITKESVTLEEVIEHGFVYEEVDGKFRDQHKVLSRGKDGEKLVTYEVTYADGVETGRVVIAEEVTVEAVDEVVERGIERRADEIGSGGTFVDKENGDVVGYERVINGECTAYSWLAGNVTSTCESVQFGYVAVDPRVIPYGSLLYITSPSWHYGYCYAMDTGGAAMSGRIVVDLFYDSEDVCNSFGRRDMTVYVIQEGGYHGW